MYRAVFEIDGYSFHGTLDMHVLKMAQMELEECGKELKVHEILKGVAEFDMHCISALLLQSVIRCGEITEKEFLSIYIRDRNEDEIERNFVNITEYFSKLMKRCMPKSDTNSEEDEFEDVPEFKEEEKVDWDFPYMEFLWSSKLNKNNFWEVTPKNYFEQINIYRKLNGEQEETEDVEYL